MFSRFAHTFTSDGSRVRRRIIPVVITVGCAYMGYRSIYGPPSSHPSIVTVYTRLPWNAVSRIAGKASRVELTDFARTPIFQLFIKLFNCNIEEAADTDLRHYQSVAQFFTRALKPGVRPIDGSASITSPSDGRILCCGKVKADEVEQVKGVTYSLHQFLGPVTWTRDGTPGAVSQTGVRETDYIDQIKHGRETEIFQCVIYLAPGDYHRFHSPAQWNVTYRRYFPGMLLSVNPVIARRVKGLFNINERVAYIGHWQHGFFALSAVGATCVGSIKVYHDKALATNVKKKARDGMTFNDVDFVNPSSTTTSNSTSQRALTAGKSFNLRDTRVSRNTGISRDIGTVRDTGMVHDIGTSRDTGLPTGLRFNKGDKFGEFNFGSTIVLVFEAPRSFEFNVEPGQTIKYGQSLGRMTDR